MNYLKNNALVKYLLLWSVLSIMFNLLTQQFYIFSFSFGSLFILIYIYYQYPKIIFSRNFIFSIIFILYYVFLYYNIDYYKFTILNKRESLIRVLLSNGLSYFIISLLVELNNLVQINKMRGFLIKKLSFVFFIVAIFGIINEIRFPGISRDISNNSFNGFIKVDLPFIWNLPYLLAVYILIYYRYKKNKIKRFVLISSFIILIIFARYSILYIITLILLISLYFVKKKESNYKYIMGFILLLLLLFILYNGLCYLADLDIVGVSSKAQDIVYFINTGNSEGDLYERTFRYQRSYDTFLNNKLYGSGNQSLSGGHSYWLDILAEYGLIGFFINFFMLLSIYCRAQKIMRGYLERKIYLLIFIVFLIFGFVNPYAGGASFYIYVFYMIPLLVSYYFNRK